MRNFKKRKKTNNNMKNFSLNIEKNYLYTNKNKFNLIRIFKNYKNKEFYRLCLK
jgi:hypothetical protein